MDWTGVVAHPLGLVAFVVALTFAAAGVHVSGYLSARGRRPRRPWVLVVALSVGIAVVAGGLYLAREQVVRPSVTQTTSGDMSPAIQGVEGNVELNQTRTSPQKVP